MAESRINKTTIGSNQNNTQINGDVHGNIINETSKQKQDETIVEDLFQQYDVERRVFLSKFYDSFTGVIHENSCYAGTGAIVHVFPNECCSPYCFRSQKFIRDCLTDDVLEKDARSQIRFTPIGRKIGRKCNDWCLEKGREICESFSPSAHYLHYNPTADIRYMIDLFKKHQKPNPLI